MEKTTRMNLHTRFSTEYAIAMAEKADRWVAACGGNEIPFTHEGTEWLYVYNCRTNEHGYLNLGTDIVQEHAPWDRA